MMNSMSSFLVMIALTIWEKIKSIPPLEGFTLLILIIITVYRRRLSSNNEYRNNRKTNKVSDSFIHKIKNLDSNIIFDKFRKPKIGKISFEELTLELKFYILGYLDNLEICAFFEVSKKLNSELDTDLFWEQLWLQTYGEMWHDPKVKLIRETKGIFWDPLLNFGPPQMGWKRFYLIFEICWMDWILAGYCSHECSLIGINNSILDVTDFTQEHPGSPETILEACGSNSSEQFQDIGHSTHAYKLMSKYYLYDFKKKYPGKIRSRFFESNEEFHKSQLNRTPKKNFIKPFSNLVSTRLSLPQESKLHAKMKLYKKALVNLIQSKKKNLLASVLQSSRNGFLSFSDFFQEKEPSGTYFSDAFDLIPFLGGFYECNNDDNHFGQPKVFYDPLQQEWNIWWTCCGKCYTFIDRKNNGQSNIE